ncbi:hypothetical protein FXO38_14588 [Capsicum annuum]|nr:hypothetical protein FXO38_14588 [Capsicum annuum]KAF3657848.1 hypothetical protein FXO37_14703 [Capsicum annuum]
MRVRKLVYQNAYDVADRIMDLNFYNNFKNRYNDLKDLAKTLGGPKFDWLVSMYEWEEDMIKYVREKRPYPHGKNWSRAKRILAIMNMEVKHFVIVEILLEEENSKVYDFNLTVLNDDVFLSTCIYCWSFFPAY